MIGKALIKSSEIQKRILTFRDRQVMLDSDLAEFYGVETKRLNEQVKRNIDRFPKEFCFQLTDVEYESLKCQIGTSNYEPLLRSQIATSKKSLKSQSATAENRISLRSQIAASENRGGRRTLPYVFTEQGVAMLSAVLHSETAVKMSIQIINAFVSMRRFLSANAEIFKRLDNVEFRQTQAEIKIDTVFKAIESKQIQPKQGIFFDGQIFDAYKFVCGLIRKARRSVVLIDNFVDDTVLDILTKRKKGVSAEIYTRDITNQLSLDLKKHNAQYPAVVIKEFKVSHDRFLIIDDKDVYHIGASLKDLGKKWFAFSKMDIDALNVLSKLKV